MLFLLLSAVLLSERVPVPVSRPVESPGGVPPPQLPVEVELLSPPPGQLYIEDLWRVRLYNYSDEIFSVYLFVTIEEVSRGLLMDATTGVFLLPPGIMVLSSVELSPVKTEFYDSDFESSVGIMGGFPDGTYIVTIYVYEDGGGLLGSGGITHNVQNHSPPELMHPADGSEVTEPLPLFTWMPAIPSSDISYSVRIVETLAGQSPQSAITANPAWFMLEGLDSSELLFPVYADRFQSGRLYAWQVEGFYQGVSVGASGVWTFTYQPEGPGLEEGTELWSFETGDRVYCSPAISPDGSIVCGSDDGSVYSLDAAGEEQWRYTAGGPVFGVTVGPDGRIYATGSFGICCLDASGFPLWRNPLSGRVTANVLLLPSGMVFAGASGGIFHALDGFTGETLDTLHAGGEIYLSAAADSGGRIYFACEDGSLHGIEYDEGFQRQWVFRVDDAFTGGPVLFGGRLYAAAGSEVFCFSREGEQLWKSSLSSPVYTGPVVSSSGVVYAGTGSGNVYALKADTGERTGVVPAGAAVTSTPAMTVTGALAFGCEDGRLHSYSPSGFSLWTFQTGDQVRSSPVIGIDGTVYFGSDDHRIYAVSGSGAGPMTGGWPQFCLNSFKNPSLAEESGEE